MSKTITFEYDEKVYTLEYTKDSIRQMERGGFVADDLKTKPMTILPGLFAGAFIEHHGTVKRSKIDAIYPMMGDKRKLVGALTEMYNEVVESLLDEPEEGKNVAWTPSWENEEI